MTKVRTVAKALPIKAFVFAAMMPLASLTVPTYVSADETCNSPYMTALIKGQEKYLQVWTLGEKGVGDESDKLTTIDVDPASKTYGKVVSTASVGGRGEAHHMGFSDDRKYLWAGRLDDNKIFVFDVGTDPAKPKLVKTITDFPQKSGFVGPHTFYAIPGRFIVGALSNNQNHGGETGLAVYSNAGEFLSKHPLPTTNGGDGYGYDIGINPEKNAMLTSSFTGWNNYMMDFGKLVKDPEAMKHFGTTMVMWNLKSMQPSQIFNVPGAPLEIRWSLKKGDDWAITATALTAKLWLIKHDANGKWEAKDVGPIGDPSKIPLPVDISIGADAKTLWVNTFLDGKTHLFDISDPEHPKQIYEKVIGSQVNMVSQSWDGKRVYFTTSLLSNWDKKGGDDQQFLKAYDWDGKELTEKFEVDFNKEKLGRAHHMKFTGGRLSNPDYPAGVKDPDAKDASGNPVTFSKQGPRSLLIRICLAAALSTGAAGLPRAEGLSSLDLPAPGTYSLDKIQKAPFSLVRDEKGLPRLLSTFTTGKVTLLTFFYSQCADPQGCPLAWNAFEGVRQKIKADPQLAGRARLVFYSFDPVHDTSSTLQLFAQGYKADAPVVPWRFITGLNDGMLRKTLDAFGQDVSAPTIAPGADKRVVINHLLKAFLIDREGYVREIYTSNFLDPKVLTADIKTLVMEENKTSHGG